MRFSKLPLLAVCALIASSVNADPSDYGFTVYDDFSARQIDPDRWAGNQTFEHIGEEEFTPWNSLELERAIKRDPSPGEKRGKASDGALHLVNTLQGSTADQPGISRSRLGYTLLQKSGVYGIGARFRVSEFETQQLPNDCFGVSRSRLRVIGRLFNADYAEPLPGDSTGEVMAYVALRGQHGAFDGKMRAEAIVFKCLDAPCDAVDTQIFHPFDYVDTNEEVVLTGQYLVTHFVFRYESPEGDEQLAIFENPWNVVGPAQGGGGIGLQAALDLPDCQTEPAFGYIDALVDEFYVKRLEP